MSVEDNKAVVVRWFTDFWGSDFDPAIIDEIAAPDIRFEYSLHQPLRGRDAVREFALRFRAAFPDLGRARPRRTSVASPDRRADFGVRWLTDRSDAAATPRGGAVGRPRARARPLGRAAGAARRAPGHGDRGGGGGKDPRGVRGGRARRPRGPAG